jgi:predicted MFS family arabinose efflux permease
VVGPARRTSSILAVTVVAGFASSIFLPLTGLLLAQLGWRHTLLVLAGVLATIAVPAHLLAVPGRRSRSRRPTSSGPAAATALRDAGFWLLTSSFAVHAAATSAMGVLLVGYLVHAGHSTTVAATLAGLLGVLSVTGRLATTGFARRYSMARVTAAMFALQGAGAAALPLAGPRLAGAAACVTAFGLGFGIATIAKPAILADRYGTSGFATIAAAMSVPVIAAKAAAPLVAASLAPTVFTTSVSLLCLLSAVLLALSARPRGSHSALVRPNRTD